MNAPTNVAIASAMGGKARRVQADAFAAAILPAIAEARASGAITLQEIADILNAKDIQNARGGAWSRSQVWHVEARAA